MKKTAFSLLGAVLLLVTACGERGNGVVTSQSRPLSDFTHLEVVGEYQVQWTPGSPAFKVTADENLLPHITAIATGPMLIIDSDVQLSPTQPITIILSSPLLNNLGLTGSPRIRADGLSGPAFKITSAGDGDITLSGEVRDLDVTLTGNASLHAHSLRTRTAEMILTGSPIALIAVSRSLEATITGDGRLVYTGNPRKVTKTIAGSGAVIRTP